MHRVTYYKKTSTSHLFNLNVVVEEVEYFQVWHVGKCCGHICTHKTTKNPSNYLILTFHIMFNMQITITITRLLKNINF